MVAEAAADEGQDLSLAIGQHVECRAWVADVLRQIGHDERMHKLDSERAAQGQRPEAAEGRDTDDIRRAA